MKTSNKKAKQQKGNFELSISGSDTKEGIITALEEVIELLREHPGQEDVSYMSIGDVIKADICGK